MHGERRLAPSLIAHSAAISACANAARYERARALLDELSARWGLEPDVMAYNALLCA